MAVQNIFSRIRGLAPGLSRRDWLRKAAVAGGGLGVISGLPQRTLADDEDGGGNRVLKPQCEQPFPIPHLSTTPAGLFHFFFPGPADSTAPGDVGKNPSLITDFKGVIGQADLTLTGTGTDTTTGAHGAYSFHTDSRFMKGQWIGLDGKKHSGAFAFI
jgi:hypothetical protein